VVGDLGTLGERAVAVAVDPGVVDEEIPAALIRRDEAEALLVAEPLHGSGRHVSLHCVRATCAEEVVCPQRTRVRRTAFGAGAQAGLTAQNVAGDTRLRQSLLHERNMSPASGRNRPCSLGFQAPSEIAEVAAQAGASSPVARTRSSAATASAE